MRPRRLVFRLAVVVLLGTAAAACAEAIPDQTTASPTASDRRLGATQPDSQTAELETAVEDLRTTLTEVLGALDEAAAAGEVAAAREAAERAVHALSADPDLQRDLDRSGAAADPGVAPLFPGPLTSREETIDYGDLFTRVLNVARAAGTDGGDLIELMREPIAGDIGIWQRNAAGQYDAIEQAAASRSVEAAEPAVFELGGEGTRALAYALLATRATDLDTVHAYAERGAAHAGLMLDAVTTLEIHP